MPRYEDVPEKQRYMVSARHRYATYIDRCGPHLFDNVIDEEHVTRHVQYRTMRAQDLRVQSTKQQQSKMSMTDISSSLQGGGEIMT